MTSLSAGDKPPLLVTWMTPQIGLVTRESGSETTPTARDSSGRAVKATPAAKKKSVIAVRSGGGSSQCGQRYSAAQRRGSICQREHRILSTQATGDATDFTLVPLTPMRRIIAERMRAGSSVPTFTAEIEVDMTGCIQLRSELNEHSKGTGSAITTLLRSAPPSLSRTILS